MKKQYENFKKCELKFHLKKWKNLKHGKLACTKLVIKIPQKE